MDAFRTAAARVTEAELPEVQVLGIDETRRSRTRWEQDPDTGKWGWNTGFVDALGTGGLHGGCTRAAGADRQRVGRARWKFLTCAASDIPEVRTLAATVDRWWPEIAAFIDTGHSNARSEGINRVIKLVARNAVGFRSADSQRLRTRCVTTRRARGHLRTPKTRQGTHRPVSRTSASVGNRMPGPGVSGSEWVTEGVRALGARACPSAGHVA
ncbi:transposase [Streptomyces xiangluensis]|uniref:Transposase n=1 Tax=Streptomyces xiangluensis TaxID=2665720 RepID=A0ABV8YGT0_9ACTN